jgi:hypothetical protein
LVVQAAHGLGDLAHQGGDGGVFHGQLSQGCEAALNMQPGMGMTKQVLSTFGIGLSDRFADG